jgi:hypothetical protein
MSTHTLEVRPNEVAGWDVLHEDDPDAITNVATKEQAVEAAGVLASEEGDSDVVVREEPHELSGTERGVRLYVLGLVALLGAVTVLIIVISLITSALNI